MWGAHQHPGVRVQRLRGSRGGQHLRSFELFAEAVQQHVRSLDGFNLMACKEATSGTLGYFRHSREKEGVDSDTHIVPILIVPDYYRRKARILSTGARRKTLQVDSQRRSRTRILFPLHGLPKKGDLSTLHERSEVQLCRPTRTATAFRAATASNSDSGRCSVAASSPCCALAGSRQKP